LSQVRDDLQRGSERHSINHADEKKKKKKEKKGIRSVDSTLETVEL
jgi:hypothetical protein